MQYALLIYGDEARQAASDEAAQQKVMMGHFAFTRALREANIYIGGEALDISNNATSVRNKGGQRLVTDGPFAETKEQLGGFYLISADTLDEAIEWADKLAVVDDYTIEVRPIWDTSSMVPSDAGAGQQASA
jgi:hypothetical protein